MHHATSPLTIDPAAVAAWLRQPDDQFTDTTRAQNLGVDDDLTGAGVAGFLAAIDRVLAAQPDGLDRRADLAGVQLWLFPDGDILDRGALVTVDLANGIRLCTPYQDIKDFADRRQHGIPAVLAALHHIAEQVALVVGTYQEAGRTQARDEDVAR